MAKRKKKQSKKNSGNLGEQINRIRKIYGDASIFRYGDGLGIDIEAISTSSIKLDIATGIGGVPRGRVVEFYGPESSGKTTLALHVIAEAQKLNGVCCFIDAEHALDVKYAKNLGVNVDDLLLSQPDYGEQALDIAEKVIDSNDVAVIVVDSVAALVPKAEFDGEMGDATIALQARMMSQALRKLSSKVSKSKTCLIFINQIRKKIGVMFGNPETTSGGGALKFYASMRMDIRRIGSEKSGDDIISNKTKVKIIKNKLSSPFKEARFNIRFGMGIDKYDELVELAVNNNLIKKKGNWYHIETKKKKFKFNGKEKLIQALMRKEVLFNKLKFKLTGIKEPLSNE